jgi:hypothetical protein
VCYALIEKETYNVQIALMCWLVESPYREDFVQRYIERIPHFTRNDYSMSGRCIEDVVFAILIIFPSLFRILITLST